MTTLSQPEGLAGLVQRMGDAVLAADALLLATGSGMGVASGLATVRGVHAGQDWRLDDGRACTYKELVDPLRYPLAHDFWSHAWCTYTKTDPHRGYELLRQWSGRAPLGGFVFTSNIDGQHEKSGYPKECIYECHGSIMQLQCAQPCRIDIREARKTDWAEGGVRPSCDSCGQLARPNVMMFNDGNWIGDRSEQQQKRYQQWVARLFDPNGGTSKPRQLVILEIGAGVEVTTVRTAVEQLLLRAQQNSEQVAATLVRVNPVHYQVPQTSPRHLSVPVEDTVELLSAVDAYLKSKSPGW
jgi:NAD-dependent SIR2 family protein deacetylase